MHPPHPDASNPWSVERLRLPASLVGDLSTNRRPPRHRPGETFLLGPIPFGWVATACRLPGSGLAVAMAVRFLRGRYRRKESWSHAEIGLRVGLSLDSTRRGLRAAERAGLVLVDREPGCKPGISVTPWSEPGGESVRRPLYGPIPWSWWLPASRLSGSTLRVAVACWLLAGWERAAEVELALGEWRELGLSRPTAGRGLVELERAELVAVERRRGESPIVTILEPPQVVWVGSERGAGGREVVG